MSYWDIQYLILKLFTNQFDLFNCIFALGVMVCGLQSKVRGPFFMHYPVKEIVFEIPVTILIGFAMFGQFLGTTNSRKLLPIKLLPCCAYWIWRYYPVRFTGIGSLNATNILPYYTELLIFNFSFLILLTNVVCM